MDDTISRAKAINALSTITVYKGSIPYNTAVMRINKLPSAQPEPKRGKWIGKYPVSSICSECGYLINDSKVKVFAFCPNCGVDMRGEQDDSV